jgi:hypothetical protein
MFADGISAYCPHCHQHTAISPAPLAYRQRHKQAQLENSSRISKIADLDDTPCYQSGSSLWWMGRCNACDFPVLVLNAGQLVLPPPRPAPVSDEIPEPMQSDLREAKQCLAVSACNAAVVMARRALQCAAIEQGAPKGKLAEQIKWLDDNRKITAQQRQWADAARWVGNHGAHDTEPNVPAGQPVITDVTHEDASDTIDLVEHLFETLYIANQRAHEQLRKRGKLKS